MPQLPHDHAAGGCRETCPLFGTPRQNELLDRDDERAENAAFRRAHEAIETWWLDNAHAAIKAVVPKAVEYGSTDLAELGRDLALLMNREGMSHEELTELGIYMYMLGKFSRWRDAIKDGRRVSIDTIYDIKVYATMAERNRAVGGWPFNPEEKT